ncbi:2-isopropylmalate synthase [Aerosakkonemataceae cyanobacterium BLCC-F50]|uniref:2-isopropylmalate synthase n=1 Tax=Floridaenema flaviceps BLCC-F50 TaxID=3153642 RepID=A0ABV4XPP1_9CYAN
MPGEDGNKVIIFDTTLRDGELMPGVQINVEQKLELAQFLEFMKVDVIEVGYPAAKEKDFAALFQVAQLVKDSIVCALASDKLEEIMVAAQAIKPAAQGRIHLYTSVNLKERSIHSQAETLARIKESVTTAKNYCADVEWSAFDATRCEPDFLCQAVETACASGATTISIPDSLGTASPESFAQLIQMLQQRVREIDCTTLSVHCHDDLGLAVENSITALHSGARQIECSINGLGARKGNADLVTVVREIARMPDYYTNVNLNQLDSASELVKQIIEKIP